MKRTTLAKAALLLLVPAILVVVLILAVSASGETPEVADDGYYLIGTADDLAWFAEEVNGGNSAINGRLTEDIVLNPGYTFTFEPDTGLVRVAKNDSTKGYFGTNIKGDGSGAKTFFDTAASVSGAFYATDTSDAAGTIPADLTEWTPIGTNTTQYTGKFDGNGKCVSGLYYHHTQKLYFVGLFGYLRNGTVENTTVENSFIWGAIRLGGISGMNLSGTVRNCTHSGVVLCYDLQETGSAGSVGGICGMNSGRTENCVNTGVVGGGVGSSEIGGISGNSSSSQIRRCYNTGRVNGGFTIGGIAGLGYVAADCFNTGVVTGNKKVGSIAGVKGYSISNCFYLSGSAVDSLGTEQNGVGAATAGEAAADIAGEATGETAAQFSDGTVVGLLNGTSTPLPWYQGDGIPMLYRTMKPVDGFYQIETVGDLLWFAEQVNGGNTAVKAILMNPIAFNSAYTFGEDGILSGGGSPSVWTPIGTAEHPFTGVFDANGQTVSGLYVNDGTADGVGFFGHIGSGAVVKNGMITGSYIKGNNNVGGVFGTNAGTVSGFAYTGVVSGNAGVGGIGGSNEGAVSSSYSTGSPVGVCGAGAGTVTDSFCLADAENGNGGRTAAQFADGSVTFALNGNRSEGTAENPLLWYQKLTGEDADARPTQLGDAESAVYITVAYDEYGFFLRMDYGNTALPPVPELDRRVQPATLNDGYHEIANPGQLLWFSERVREAAAETVLNGRLTGDIDLNRGYTFAFMPDTGLVRLEKNGETAGYLGTGVKGAVGGADAFDGTASERGAFYPSDTDTGTGTAPDGLLAWKPIGADYAHGFVGTFDGNGKRVSGLYFNDTAADKAGLFGCIRQGTVKDVTVGNFYVNGNADVGGVSGNNYCGTISGCRSNGITVGLEHVGGAVGRSFADQSLMSDCSASGMTAGTKYVGGVVGRVSDNGDESATKVSACFGTGPVFGTEYVGGLCGYANEYNSIVIENCYSTGAVVGNGYVGGLIGSGDATFKSCFSTSAVTGNYATGGFNGSAYGNQSGCFHLADKEDKYGGRTAAQFADGRVTFALNGNRCAGTPEAPLYWFQKLTGDGANALPTLSGNGENTVYVTVSYDEFGFFADASFGNTPGNAMTAFEVLYQPATPVDGYCEISNAGQLCWFAGTVNAGSTDLCAKLTADIHVNPGFTFRFDPDTGLVAVASDGSTKVWLGTGIRGNGDGASTAFDETPSVIGAAYSSDDSTVTVAAPDYLRIWSPIGVNSWNAYGGVFDGNGKTVSGLYINQAVNASVGFFGCQSGTIRDLTVAGSYLRTGGGAGGVCGYNIGTVTHCRNDATVIGNGNVGGICGVSDNQIDNCINTGVVVGRESVGGICGYMEFNARYTERCFHSGTVLQVGMENTAAIVGAKYGGEIRDCYFLAGSATCGINANAGGDWSDLSPEDEAAVRTEEEVGNGTVAWQLNTGNRNPGEEGYAHSGIWSQGEYGPVFADGTDKPIYKITLTGVVEKSFFRKLGETLSLPETVHSADGTTSETVTEADIILDIDAAITGVTPTVTDSISFAYGVTVAKGLVPTLLVTLDGKTVPLTAEGTENGDNGNYTDYIFRFDGILPQQMTENISATLMIGETAYAAKSEYSVRTYAFNRLAASGSEEFRAFLVTMLCYGAAAQTHLGQTEQLATDGLAELLGGADALAAFRTGDVAWKTFTPESVKRVSDTNDIDLIQWKSATLVFDRTITMRLYFTVSVENSALLEGCLLAPALGDPLPLSGGAVYDKTEGNLQTYHIDLTGYTPTSYGDTAAFTILNAEGEPVSETVTYSVLSYIASMKDSKEMKTLVRALYDYGCAAVAYQATIEE